MDDTAFKGNKEKRKKDPLLQDQSLNLNIIQYMDAIFSTNIEDDYPVNWIFLTKMNFQESALLRTIKIINSWLN